jgi:hypothetical protein
MADQTYTDAAVEMVVESIYGPADHPAPSPEVNAFGGRLRRKATAVLDVLVAAGWAPRAEVAEKIAQAIEGYDGPLSDGPRTTLARIARAHGQADHG